MIIHNTLNLSQNTFSETDYESLLSFWDISFQTTRPDIQIQGSPERTSYRIVVEDDAHQLFILEQFSKQRYAHKQMISNILETMSTAHLAHIQAYLKTKNKQHIVSYHTTYWQLIPYISGIPLNRPDHLHDDWRGTQSAKFLIELYKKTSTFQHITQLKQFSLKKYVLTMKKQMKTYHPQLYIALYDVITYLNTDFFKHDDKIPFLFCHGDYHPLNILWSQNSIHAVIDWEFAGMKPDHYDIANMLGCIGIENPNGLFQEYALEFLKEIKRSHLISEIGLHYLVDCIIALRFGWLAEWIRKNDTEMIDLEITYIKLLVSNKKIIKKRWQI